MAHRPGHATGAVGGLVDGSYLGEKANGVYPLRVLPRAGWGSIKVAELHGDPAGPDRDCGDFPTWRQAQDFFEAAGGPARDPHRLDADHDGIACESLPGAS